MERMTRRKKKKDTKKGETSNGSTVFRKSIRNQMDRNKQINEDKK